MKKLLKICATALPVATFFFTMAVVIETTTTPFVSEPATMILTMILIGISLIGVAILARKGL